jgi:hypothetical protein
VGAMVVIRRGKQGVSLHCPLIYSVASACSCTAAALVTRYAVFPLGNTSDTTSNGWADQDNYTIRQWLGILGGNASTSIIDTSLYCDITIEITLALIFVQSMRCSWIYQWNTC